MAITRAFGPLISAVEIGYRSRAVKKGCSPGPIDQVSRIAPNSLVRLRKYLDERCLYQCYTEFSFRGTSSVDFWALQFHEHQYKPTYRVTHAIDWPHQGLIFVLLWQITEITNWHIIVHLGLRPQDTADSGYPQIDSHGLGIHTPPTNIILLLVVHYYGWYYSRRFIVLKRVQYRLHQVDPRNILGIGRRRSSVTKWRTG